MNKTKRFLTLAAVAITLALCTVCMFACTGDGLSGIEITTRPYKVSYTVGEAFDADGLTVTAVYKDGKKEAVTDFTLSAPDMATAGEKTVTVTYNKKTASFKITVAAPAAFTGISIDTASMQRLYGLNEVFDKNGLVVRAEYDNGTQTILKDYTLSAVDTSSIGEKTVTVTFSDGKADYEQSFKIEVLNKVGFTPCTQEEQAYLYRDFMSDPWLKDGARLHRSVNQDKTTKGEENAADLGIGAYTVYAFEYPTKITRAVLFMEMRFFYKIEASFDGESFFTIDSGNSDAQSTEFYTYDLNARLDGTGGKPDFAACANKLYVRTSSALPVSGTDLYGFALYADTQAGGAVTPSMPLKAEYRRAAFAASAKDDAYLFAADNSYTVETVDGTLLRTLSASAGAYFTYAIDLGGAAAEIELWLKLDWYFKASVSFDNITFVTLRDTSEIYDENTIPPRAPRAFDLKTVLNASAIDFATNGGKVFVKIENASPRADKGFGGAFISLSADYKLADDAAFTEAKPVAVHEAGFMVNTEKETQFLVKDEGSEIKVENDFIPGTEDKKDFDTRILWQDAHYFVYGFDAGSKLDFAQIVFRSKNSRKVDVSFDGVSWANLVNVAGGSGSESFTLRLDSAQGFGENTGIVYIRMDGFDSAAGGWGLQLYDFKLQYMLVAEQDFTELVPAPALPEQGMPVQKTDETVIDITYTEGGDNAQFIYEDVGTAFYTEGGKYCKYVTSPDGYFVYAIDFQAKLTSFNLFIEAYRQHQLVQISLDGNTWQTLKDAPDGVWSYVEKTEADITGFDSNTGKIFVKISGRASSTGDQIGITQFKVEVSK